MLDPDYTPPSRCIDYRTMTAAQPGPAQPGADGTVPSAQRRRRTRGWTAPTARRQFLRGAGGAATLALAGCLGGGTGSTAGADTGPDPPWTTQDLVGHIDADAKLTIYAGTGDSEQWYDLIAVINDEFGVNLQANVFASDGGKVSQRFLQEHQSGNDKVDIMSVATDIRDQILLEGEEVAREYYEWDIDRNFWFTDVLPDERVLPFLTAAFNGGAGSALPINVDLFEERGLDVPQSYNDLFEDQYAGLTTLLPGYIVAGSVGWIIRHHAAELDMSDLEWITALKEHLDFTGSSSHTAGAREVRDGTAPMMFYNFPWVIGPFVGEDSPLEGIFVDGVKSDAIAGPVAINKRAPNPWVARFFVSALLEEPVQRRMIHEVTDQVPVRTDLDYAAQNPDPFTMKRLNADVTLVPFWESGTYSKVGQQAKDAGAFDV